MPTLPEIQQQIAAIPHRYVFWTQKEIRALPDILTEGEEVCALTSGMMDGATWLAVCTHSRLVFVNRGMFFGLRQFQIPLNRVQAIDHDYKLLFGAIRVWDGASYFTLRMVLKSSIDPFVRRVQECIEAYRRGVSAPTPATAPAKSGGITGELERLAALRERGALTEEEFQAQKKRVLEG